MEQEGCNITIGHSLATLTRIYKKNCFEVRPDQNATKNLIENSDLNQCKIFNLKSVLNQTKIISNLPNKIANNLFYTKDR